ncbi:hypothetical protein [Oceanirhabdus sp. W0125-5]|uniref:hypothetical protein n=1 Tax=Oceanirhabdus sp. W0125-5 TaxID=2999116 RepID=UPI0022F2FD07|nr:hypothetical protein [Oceanirhabdus sp. W0125-5]WBW96229.1 hypothetical protein OW730_21430 [Oceanirhabdus sp. W0125-5]
MNKRMIFSNIEQVKSCREKIVRITNEKVKELLNIGTGLELLRQVKFTQNGYDPLFEKPLNFIEQTNQTFTYLVSLAALEHLLTLYPNRSFSVNFGTSPGYDIESEDGSIICECFAATAPDSNYKLKKDVERLVNNQLSTKKYVIYYAEIQKEKHVDNIRNKYKEVEIISLSSLGI